MAKIFCFLVLMMATIAVRSSVGADTRLLPIVFCTPEHSSCALAGNASTDRCFSPASLQENFYFGIFSTLGNAVTVDRLVLQVGAAPRTKYAVSIASGARAHDLQCSSTTTTTAIDGRRTLECPAGMLANVTSLMIRPEPLPTRLRVLEVAAYRMDGGRANFSYCVADPPSTADDAECRRAMDFTAAADSPAAETADSSPFPAWHGGFASPEPVQSVRIYRPAGNSGETFYRVVAAGECARAASSVDAGVEVLEFRCSGQPVVLLQVWEIDAQYLISLCQIDVYGME